MTIARPIHTTAPTAHASTTRRSRLAAFAAITAGIGIVTGHALTIDPSLPAGTYIHDLTAHHTSGLIGGLLTSVAAFLLIPGLTALLALVRGTGATLATLGAVLTGCAAAALGAGDTMITLVMSALVEHHPDTAATVLHVANSEALLSLPFTLAPLMVIGLVLLGIALLRAKTVPAWQPVLLIGGALLVIPSGGGGLLTAAILTPLGVALVALGSRAARTLPTEPDSAHS